MRMVISFMAPALLMLPLGSKSLMRESLLTKTILYKSPIVSRYTERFTLSLKEVYDTIHHVTKKEISSEEANTECLDIMLRYKMVNKKTVEGLIQKEKIKNTDAIAEILKSY